MKHIIYFLLVFSSLSAIAGMKYSEAEFDKLLKSGENLLAHVHADWCPTCKIQKKNLALIEEKNFKNIEVNFDDDKNFIKKYKVYQQSTFVAFSNGSEIARKGGITTKEDIEVFIKNSFPTNLQSKLDEKRSSSQAPTEIKMTMEAATKKLEDSGILKKAKQKGQSYIDFTLPNVNGGNLKLSEALKKGPVVLTFYRGGWCPYCNIQLKAYQDRLEDFKKRGASLVAISPETMDSSATTVQKNELKFDILFDKNNTVARKYGIVFKIENDLKAVYEKFGIDLEKNQNNKSWELPIPATYVIAPNGEIVYSFLNVDYVKRAEPNDILKALDSI